MRVIARITGLLLGTTLAAMGQATPGTPVVAGDAALTYHWIHSNTQPGDCGCFYLNGGGISGSWNLRSQLAMVAEISGEVATNGPSTGNSLTLTSYLAGARFILPQLRRRTSHSLQPFAQLLVGAAHAGGGIAGAGDNTTAFATHIGGGIDLLFGSRFAVRIAQADYDLTEFANSTNNHQNNLLLSAGVVYRWSQKR
jgi:hypothetical protein